MNLSLLEARIKAHEGFRSRPYRDIKGKLTIGFGRNLDDNPLTEEEGWFLSKGPIAEAISHAPLLVHNWDGLGDARQNVLIELVYNIGLTKALKFREMRRFLDERDFPAAASELLDSEWRVEVGPTRSGEMADQLRTGLFAP